MALSYVTPVSMDLFHQFHPRCLHSATESAGRRLNFLAAKVTEDFMIVITVAYQRSTGYERFVCYIRLIIGWPNKNRTFLRYHIFAATKDNYNHVVFAEVF